MENVAKHIVGTKDLLLSVWEDLCFHQVVQDPQRTQWEESGLWLLFLGEKYFLYQ